MKYRYYIVPEYEDPKGTDDREIALAATSDCTVIDTETGKELSGNEDILEADRNDYIDDDSDEDGEDE